MDIPPLPTLAKGEIIQVLKEAVHIIDVAAMGKYEVAAFEVVARRLMDDAYAQLAVENVLMMKKVAEAIQ